MYIQYISKPRLLLMVFIYIISSTFVTAAYSKDLESYGWKKKVDDLKGTTSFAWESEYAYGCGGGSIAAVFGLVTKKDNKPARLTIMVVITGQEDLNQINELQWKTDDGIKSHKMVCQKEINSGLWTIQCVATGLSKNIVSSLSNTTFIRLNGSKGNIDVKDESGNKCIELYKGFKTITKEYVEAN